MSKLIETITISKKEYLELRDKANGFDLSKKAFSELRQEILPTEQDTRLPWYDMLVKCVKNKQLK